MSGLLSHLQQSRASCTGAGLGRQTIHLALTTVLERGELSHFARARAFCTLVGVSSLGRGGLRRFDCDAATQERHLFRSGSLVFAPQQEEYAMHGWKVKPHNLFYDSTSLLMSGMVTWFRQSIYEICNSELTCIRNVTKIFRLPRILRVFH